MTDNDNFSSDFTPDFNPRDAGSAIDFTRAKRLNTTGSTCDAYVTELKHRKVFVKRLKAKYRNSARYRAAFEKEYEIGVGLSHPALPVYIDFQGDYIVMNYIDGRTLAEMMESGDEWLSKEKNAVRVLAQLLDVLEYLHRKDVIHCDIKADNVLLTYAGNNVALIDLDKGYTSHLSDTSGSATKYGLEESDKRNTDIDFAGLARIADQLSKAVKSAATRKLILRLSKECKKQGITAEELKSILHSATSYTREERRQMKLEEDRKENRLIISIIIGCLVVMFVAYFLKLQQDKSESGASEEIETITPDSIQENNTAGQIEGITPAPAPPRSNQSDSPAQSAKTSKDLDRYLTEHYKPLLELVDNTMRQFDNGELDEAQQRQAVTTMTERYFDLLHESYELCQELYPALTKTQAQLMVANSPVFESVTERVGEAGNRLAERFKVPLE